MEGGLLSSSVKILRSLPCIAGLYNGVYTCPPIRGYLLLYHRSGSTHDDGRHESEKTNFSFSPPEEGCIHSIWQHVWTKRRIKITSFGPDLNLKDISIRTQALSSDTRGLLFESFQISSPKVLKGLSTAAQFKAPGLKQHNLRL